MVEKSIPMSFFSVILYLTVQYNNTTIQLTIQQYNTTNSTTNITTNNNTNKNNNTNSLGKRPPLIEA
jgi:hypothetical protein